MKIQCKREGCNVSFIPGSPAAKYCGDVCRQIAGREYSRRYYSKNKKRINEFKPLTDEEKEGRYELELKFVRGTVVQRKRERRAVKVVPVIGAPVVFMQTSKNSNKINGRAATVVASTFKEIPGDSSS